MAANSDLWDHLGLREASEWPRKRLVSLFCYANLTLGYILAFNVYKYFMSPLMMALLPQKGLQWQNKLDMGFWTLCVYLLEKSGWEIEVVGDQLEVDNALLVANHRGIIDYLVMGYLVQHSCWGDKKEDLDGGRRLVRAKSLTGLFVPHLAFFTWFTIWSVPSVAYIKNILQTDENWELDGETVGGVFGEYIGPGVQWLVMFPEVNIFSDKNAKLQRMMGEKYFMPELQRVLYPRFGGVVNAVGGLFETKFTRLYDLTLLYYTKKGNSVEFGCPSLARALGGEQFKVVVHVKGKFLSRVPLKRNRIERWLENRWLKKDKLLAKMEVGVAKGKY